jgi:hypothetical protein
MSETAGGETNEYLREMAATAGYNVSKRQLAEWHRAGLLPEPRQVYGGQAGSTSQYPIGTAQRLLVLCAERKLHRRNVDVAWGLWWNGYDVPVPYVREPLEEAAVAWTRVIGDLQALLGKLGVDSDELPDAFFDLLDQVMGARIPRRVIAQARKRLGRERFATFVRVLIAVVTGTFTGYAVDSVTGDSDDERKIVEDGLGVTRGRTDRLADAGPWLTGDTEEALRNLGQLLQRYPPGYELEHITEEELARTRDEVKAFMAMLTSWSAVAEQTFGRGAFGLAGFRAIADIADPHGQASMLLLWRSLRMSDVGQAIDLFLPLAQQWQQIVQPAIAATDLLRAEVPATAELLDPKQIARGLRSKHEEERRLAALRALREEHGADLDAFFARHPELHDLVTGHNSDAAGAEALLKKRLPRGRQAQSRKQLKAEGEAL